MIFERLPLAGACLLGLERRTDERGDFARAFCQTEFEQMGLETRFPQANISTNRRAGTLRGLHLQREPHAEVKLVRCVRGAVFDVIVDLRPESPTYRQWYGTELSEENGLMMYVPRGFAHGYQALSDGATTFYMVSTFYEPSAEAGCRYDDPALAIAWPREVTALSGKDAEWPLLSRFPS